MISCVSLIYNLILIFYLLFWDKCLFFFYTKRLTLIPLFERNMLLKKAKVKSGQYNNATKKSNPTWVLH